MGFLQRRGAWEKVSARVYAKTASGIIRDLYPSIRETVEAEGLLRLAPGSVVLDAGCGAGQVLERLTQDAPGVRLLGLDFSGLMLAKAAVTLSGTGARRCDLVQGDVHHLPIATGRVDAVLSTLSLKWWADPVACLHELHRVAKPGAAVILVEMNRDATREEKDHWRDRLALSLPSRAERFVRQRLFEHAVLPRAFGPAEVERIVGRTPFDTAKITGVRGYPFLRIVLRKAPVLTSRAGQRDAGRGW